MKIALAAEGRRKSRPPENKARPRRLNRRERRRSPLAAWRLCCGRMYGAGIFPMCGIGGILRFDDRPIRPDRLSAMLDRLRHRGPDGGRGGRARAVRWCTHGWRSWICKRAGRSRWRQVGRGGRFGGRCRWCSTGRFTTTGCCGRCWRRWGTGSRGDHADTEVLLHGVPAMGGGFARSKDCKGCSRSRSGMRTRGRFFWRGTGRGRNRCGWMRRGCPGS